MLGITRTTRGDDLATAMLDVVFVDDHDTLEGLRRTMRRDRQRWKVSFLNTGDEALQLIAKRRVDVVVCGVADGCGVLEAVRESSPSTARIQLTDDPDRDRMRQSAQVAHQVLSKSCEFEGIRATVERLAESRRSLPVEHLRALVNDVQVLPTPSDVQRRLTEVLQREHDLSDIADVVETDVALSAELLRLVNSSFFGLAHRVASVRDAVGLLGLELVEATVAARSAFSDALDLPVDVAAINRHSQDVAAIAGIVAGVGGVSKLDRSLAVSAGLLHDIGVLVLAQLDPKGAATAADVLDLGDHEAERLAFGADRFAVGAHLLDLWAFSSRTPDAIRSMSLPVRELGTGTVAWSLRLAHHAVTNHHLGVPSSPDDRDWFDRLHAIERELLLSE